MFQKKILSIWFVKFLLATVTSCFLVSASNAQNITPIIPDPEQVAKTLSYEEVQENWKKFSVKDQFKIVRQFIHGAKYEEADALIRLSRYSNATEHAIARYLIGIIKRGQGDADGAIDIFRELVSAYPDFIEARVALAKTLFESQQDQSAKHQLQLLLGDAVNRPDLEQFASRHLAGIDQRKRWSLSSYVSLAPSTNLNNGTDRRVVILNGLPFTIDEGSRRQSGVGLAFGGQLGYQKPLTDKLDFLASFTLNSKVYKESDFNQLSASVSVGPRFQTQWGSIGTFITGSLGYSSNRAHNSGIGGLISVKRRLATNKFISMDFQCQERKFNNDFLGADLSGRDGHSCSAFGRIEQQHKAGFSTRLIGGIGHDETEIEHLDVNHWSAGAGIYTPLFFGLLADFQLRYTNREFGGISPGATFGRVDDRIDFTTQFINPAWNFKGYAPQLNYTYTNNTSNIDLYDFDNHAFNLTLTKKF